MSLYFAFLPIAEEHQFVECPVCLLPWSEPLEMKPCGHIMCRRCIPSDSVHCAICRSAVDAAEPPNRVLLNVLLGLQGSCSLCDWGGTNELFAAHAKAAHPGTAIGGGRTVRGTTQGPAEEWATADPLRSIPVWSDYDMQQELYESVCRAFSCLAIRRRSASTVKREERRPTEPIGAIGEADVFALVLHLNIVATPGDVSFLFDTYALAKTGGRAAELHQVLAWISTRCRQRCPEKEYGARLGVRYDAIIKRFTEVLDKGVRGVVASAVHVKDLADVADSGQQRSTSAAEAERVFLCAVHATAAAACGSPALQEVVRDGAALHAVLLALESADDGWDLTDGASASCQPLAMRGNSQMDAAGRGATAPPLTPPCSVVRGDRPAAAARGPPVHSPPVGRQPMGQPNVAPQQPQQRQQQHYPPQQQPQYFPQQQPQYFPQQQPQYFPQQQPQYFPQQQPQYFPQQQPQYFPQQQPQYFSTPGYIPAAQPTQHAQQPAPQHHKKSCNHQ
jgi:hypothetical protein